MAGILECLLNPERNPVLDVFGVVRIGVAAGVGQGVEKVQVEGLAVRDVVRAEHGLLRQGG